MKKLLLLAAACALLFCSPLTASAEDDAQDVAKISCKEFTQSKEGELQMMLMWIDGYMSGKSDNTLISTEWITKLGVHMTTYCTQNPNKTIMNAIEALDAE